MDGPYEQMLAEHPFREIGIEKRGRFERRSGKNHGFGPCHKPQPASCPVLFGERRKPCLLHLFQLL
jgi:hypothetical protein